MRLKPEKVEMKKDLVLPSHPAPHQGIGVNLSVILDLSVDLTVAAKVLS